MIQDSEKKLLHREPDILECEVKWALESITTKKASLVTQTVKCLSTMQENQVQSLGGKDLLEKEMATHSSILVWKIPWMEEPGRLQSMGLQRVRHN